MEFGPRPKARRNQSGDVAAFNKACIETGPEQMVENGQLSIKEYLKVKNSISVFKLCTAKFEELPNLQNQWIWGDSGAGKSRAARDENPDHYVKPLNKWWDGYQGESTVILDDVGKEHKFLSYFLKIWGDHYPFTGEVKGTTTKIRPAKIVVTSNYHPRDIWDDPELLKAIARRFSITQKVLPKHPGPIL